MFILTCYLQWFCTQQPGSSFSWVPCRLSSLLPLVGCPHIKQLAMGAPAAPSVHSHGAATRPHPLSLLIGSLAVIVSSGSKWLLLLSQPMRRGSPGMAEIPVHIAGLNGGLECMKVNNLEPLQPL
ncbi:unnamed protein product [Staurois parvus]|uniref:Uncharacterized protein n=1 Tax=Staurois parvus TaxID=386267 RepID=A0ABN9AHF1_9NEOB|nr:unnamed protein product [Staurois parvus]